MLCARVPAFALSLEVWYQRFPDLLVPPSVVLGGGRSMACLIPRTFRARCAELHLRMQAVAILHVAFVLAASTQSIPQAAPSR